MLGCGGQEYRVQRTFEPFAAPILGDDTGLAITGSDVALAQFKPLLDRQGIQVVDGDSRWQLEVVAVAQSADSQRVLHEHEVSDGGPLRREREYYQVKPWVFTMTLTDTYDSGFAPQEIQGLAIADPVPDQRHVQGVWILGDRQVKTLRGSFARVERAAMADAAQQLAQLMDVIKGGKHVEIILDSRGIADAEIKFALERAAKGYHEEALAQLLRKAEEASPSPQLLFNVAVLYDIMGAYDQAIQWYGRAVEAEPSERYRQALEACYQRSKEAAILPPGWL